MHMLLHDLTWVPDRFKEGFRVRIFYGKITHLGGGSGGFEVIDELDTVIPG